MFIEDLVSEKKLAPAAYQILGVWTSSTNTSRLLSDNSFFSLPPLPLPSLLPFLFFFGYVKFGDKNLTLGQSHSGTDETIG